MTAGMTALPNTSTTMGRARETPALDSCPQNTTDPTTWRLPSGHTMSPDHSVTPAPACLMTGHHTPTTTGHMTGHTPTGHVTGQHTEAITTAGHMTHHITPPPTATVDHVATPTYLHALTATPTIPDSRVSPRRGLVETSKYAQIAMIKQCTNYTLHS